MTSLTKMLTASVALSLIPCVGFGAAMASYKLLAQIPSGATAAAEQLADKSLAYWFIVLAGIAIASWTWIFKWLLGQLELQRKAHSDAVTQLITFMQTDHSATSAQLAASQATITAANAVIVRLAEK